MGKIITNILLIAILIVLVIIGKNYYNANRTQILINEVVYNQNNNNKNNPFIELIPIYTGLLVFIVIGISIGSAIKKSKEEELEKYKAKNNGKLANVIKKE